MIFCSSQGLGQVSSNIPPSVALTNPAPDAIFTFPSIIRLKATASDPDDAIEKVQFYEGTNLLGTITEAPYNLFLTNVLRDRSDYYYLTAIATDSRGAGSTSAPVRILVVQDVVLPIVTITQPSEGQAFLTPGNMSVRVTVDARDGTENPVQFFSDLKLIGIANSPPYEITVTNLSAGPHTLTAQYVDLVGSRGTSPEVHVRVTSLVLLNPHRLSDSAFGFRLEGLSVGRGFQVEASSNTVGWLPILTNVTSSNTFDFVDSTSTNVMLRFYRAFQQ